MDDVAPVQSHAVTGIMAGTMRGALPVTARHIVPTPALGRAAQVFSFGRAGVFLAEAVSY